MFLTNTAYVCPEAARQLSRAALKELTRSYSEDELHDGTLRLVDRCTVLDKTLLRIRNKLAL
jgi:hypothetical protein